MPFFLVHLTSTYIIAATKILYLCRQSSKHKSKNTNGKCCRIRPRRTSSSGEWLELLTKALYHDICSWQTLDMLSMFVIQVYFDITIDEEYVGRIKFGLFGNDVPITARNFYELAIAKDGQGYKSTRFHRVVKNFLIQGGIYFHEDGTDGMCAWSSLLSFQQPWFDLFYWYNYW